MIQRGEAGDALARSEIVVAVLEPEELYRRREGVAADLVPGAELVARALANQGRRLQADEVFRPELVRLVRWVKGITETKQPGDLAGSEELVGDHAGDAAAHRFAADDQR